MTNELLIDEMHPDPMDKMVIMGATGRISDIITKQGYDHLLDILERQDDRSKEAVQLLHNWTGWALEVIENGYHPKHNRARKE